MSMKDIWTNRTTPTISFEFFPARDEKADQKLDKVIDTLSALEPDFVSVTFGAGGSTRDGSYQLVERLKQDKKLEVLPYVAAYGLRQTELSSVLDNYHQLGIQNLFCVRGDQPEAEDFIAQPDSFSHASDFLSFVGQRYNFFKGAAGYPEGHREAVNLDQDMEYLKLKVDCGAQFIISQYSYDNRSFFAYVERCRSVGITVPIIAGVMPIYSIKMTENLATLCGATIPQSLHDRLAQLPADNKEAVPEFGTQYALEQCHQLISHGVEGLHFYTMDRAKTIEQVVKQLRAEGKV